MIPKKITVIAISSLIAVVTSLVVIAAYYRGLQGPFVFDDLTNILLPAKIHIAEVNFDTLYHAAFWEKSPVFGRPVAMLTFALNYYFAQLNPFWFKATNLAIHLVNGALLFALTATLLTRHFRSATANNQRSRARTIAIVVSIAWLLHPINLTSVLYVVQRMTSLMSLFILLGLLGYAKGRERILNGKRFGFGLIAVSIVLGTLLATLTKQNGVLLPIYALVIEIWFYRFAQPGANISLKQYWIALTSITSVCLVALLMIKPNLLSSLLNYQYRDFTLEQRLLTEARALWFYIKLMVAPSLNDLGLYHDDFVLSTSWTHPASTPFAVTGVILLIIGAFALMRRMPIFSFGIAWFLVSHSIESTIIPLELVHEHRNYLASYGILLPLIYYLVLPYDKLASSLNLRRGVAGIYIVLLALVSHARAQDWSDPFVLYQGEVRHHPNSAAAHSGLAILFHDNNINDAAEREFLAAAQLAPHDSKPLIRLAQHQFGAKGAIPPDTMRELEWRLLNEPFSGITLFTFDPLLKATSNNRAVNLRLIRLYERLLARNDIDIGRDWKAHGHETLGFAYRETKDYRRSIDEFKTAQRLSPQPAHFIVLGELYLAAGDRKQAQAMADQLANTSLSQEDKLRLQQLQSSLIKKGK